MVDVCGQLVGNLSRHISLSALKASEGFAEVELYVVAFSFHADANHDSTLRVEIEPVLSR